MTDYKALYEQKKLTADEVAARVENGWLIGRRHLQESREQPSFRCPYPNAP